MINKIKDIFGISYLILSGQTSIKNGSGIIEKFENNFKKYIGTKFAIATNNGTSSLHSAYFGCGLKENDEVIAPSYTWHATLSPLVNIRAKIIFSEVNPLTLTIDPDDVEKKITPKTKAIILVHLSGNVCDMESFLKIKKKYNIKIIEDCSHAFGAMYKEKKVGNIGDVGCFSLQESKSVSGGEAGILVTNSKMIYERALVLGQHGRLDKLTNKNLKNYSYTGQGFKYRPHPFSLILANNSLKTLKKRDKKRLKRLKKIKKRLIKTKKVRFLRINKNTKPSTFNELRVIYTGDLSEKTNFIKYLNKKGIKAKEEYYQLLHKQKIFKQKIFKKNISLAETEKIHKRVIIIKH
jgi:perosamine synthetase